MYGSKMCVIPSVELNVLKRSCGTVPSPSAPYAAATGPLLPRITSHA